MEATVRYLQNPSEGTFRCYCTDLAMLQILRILTDIGTTPNWVWTMLENPVNYQFKVVIGHILTLITGLIPFKAPGPWSRFKQLARGFVKCQNMEIACSSWSISLQVIHPGIKGALSSATDEVDPNVSKSTGNSQAINSSSGTAVYSPNKDHDQSDSGSPISYLRLGVFNNYVRIVQ
ncbi:hypothetical protein BJ085DRAFT_28087 [Dimargaris cristalligena]|uniref:Uncharacterized protein n=1 Tax=Dimargaris cristalligena TaxID=215637 RepID=A0A4P9ZLY3_9FUNG|nr:hypothetical protein BJ085DRAFT_28087 [Dimargaris cristalligena]|eukprot:RKP34173.1 hypothetical protein BJ085DRAFT_28087 [Dimargaris cristalligena]